MMLNFQFSAFFPPQVVLKAYQAKQQNRKITRYLVKNVAVQFGDKPEKKKSFFIRFCCLFSLLYNYSVLSWSPNANALVWS